MINFLKYFLKSIKEFPPFSEKTVKFLMTGAFLSLIFFTIFIGRFFYLVNEADYYESLGSLAASFLFLYIFFIYLKEIYFRKRRNHKKL